MIQTILKVKDIKRAKTKNKLFNNYIPQNSNIVDIGTGSGQYSLMLKNAGHTITSVDIKDRTNTNLITPILYDGKKLPFQNSSFDVSLLITVLHHCPEPEIVFKEALRVSKKRILILEDVYNNVVMKYLTWGMDRLVNLEFFGHPHTNKSEKDWETLFEKHDLQILQKQKLKVLFIFSQVFYVLEKRTKKEP